MHSQRKLQLEVLLASDRTSNISNLNQSSSSIQYNLSEASCGSYASTDPLRITNKVQTGIVSSNDTPDMPLSTENFALEQFWMELERVSPPCPKAPFSDSKVDSTTMKLFRKENTSKNGTTLLEHGSLEGSEWQDLLGFLEDEKKRTQILQEMDPMGRFIASDRKESPFVIGLR